jgi:hypothetical protein
VGYKLENMLGSVKHWAYTTVLPRRGGGEREREREREREKQKKERKKIFSRVLPFLCL